MKGLIILALCVFAVGAESHSIKANVLHHGEVKTISTDGLPNVGALSQRVAEAFDLPGMSTELIFVGGKQFSDDTPLKHCLPYTKAGVMAVVDQALSEGKVIPLYFIEGKDETKKLARLDTDPNETISQIKSRLQDVVGRRKTTFNLSLGKNLFDDHMTVSQCKLKSGDRVSLVARFH